ncbi:conserved hypothetical protein [Heliomicrobium modesticaldum Ice1]|uniref:Peptidase S8/S53 domain-containing protein n=1 Tax=Heliobacterium modesticaldum (strain ATCC 51547 / Ice1) TaxID=498761 RepID=B0TID7_HELMI|nr:S8 family peptidase [Heliomicrobium modesticaldum]ABZ83557.1 conserved hypothetical protein [Heliomicrobium modesticaldum Ice1]
METRRPLLIFPNPEQANRDKKSQFNPPRMHLPTPGRQGERLTPKFDELERVFAARNAVLQDDPMGTTPEQVLVLETVGSIDDFINAVKRIEGLEWMAELDEKFDADDEFFLEEKPEKAIGGRVYLVLTNQQALRSLLSLWRQYLANPQVKFQHGQGKWKKLFQHLRDIRHWDSEDRLKDTGVEDYWRERLGFGEERVRFEVELWFRHQGIDQQRSERSLRVVVEELGGLIISRTLIPEIQYHGVLAELPILQIQHILDRVDLRLLKCDQVMFFRPTGQAEIAYPDEDEVGEETLPQTDAFITDDEPVVALLDGLPLENHPLLSGRIIVDDPDGWASEYEARERKHGTAMASLIINSDLEEGKPPLNRRIYVRPILKPLGFEGNRAEEMPIDCLPIDLVHRAIKRIFEGDGEEGPQAPRVKIINLSIADRNRPFDRVMSPWARLIDWLSWQYKVLILVSGGNQLDDLQIEGSRQELQRLTAEELEEKVLQAVVRQARQRRLLSPAEAINALTVGATHEDAVTHFEARRRINPIVTQGLPSPISPVGLGYRRAIKPDVLMPGGKQLYQEPMMGQGTETPLKLLSFPGIAPGHKVACPGVQPGISPSAAFLCGTSNATALATRTTAQLYEYIVGVLRGEEGGEQLQDRYLAVLLKALFTHGAEWGAAFERFERLFCTPDNSRTFKEYAARFFGYGRVNLERLFWCTDQRATLIGCGELRDGEGHVYRVPLPPSLSGRMDNRRLIVTLAWLSPIDVGRQAYRKAALWFDPPGEALGVSRQNAQWQAVRRGTLQHEVLEGEAAVAYTDGAFMEIKINCRADAGPLTEPVPYGLAVTLSVKEDVNLPVYQEIFERLRTVVTIAPNT